MDINDIKKDHQRSKSRECTLHIRQDSASELEAMFKAVLAPHEINRTKQRPFRERDLPESFFNPPKITQQKPHHHFHSHSIAIMVNKPNSAMADHSRSSSSDSSSTSLQPISSSSSNMNNNNASMLNTPLQNLHRTTHLSPAQRRLVQAHNQSFSPNHPSQSSHNRSKSSPASLQLSDQLSVKPSDIPPNMPLPPGWSVSKTSDGQQYFLNHILKTTTWEDPRIDIIKKQRLNNVILMQQQQQQQGAGGTNAQQQVIHPNSISSEASGAAAGGGWGEQPSAAGGQQDQSVYFINNQQQQATANPQHEGSTWMDSRVIGGNMQQPLANQQQRNPQLGQMLKQPGGMDPFLGSGGVTGSNSNAPTSGGNYHLQPASAAQLDPNMNVTSPPSNYVIQQQQGAASSADEYMTVPDEDMDTSGSNALNTTGAIQQSNHQQQVTSTTTTQNNNNRFHPDFLNSLPSSQPSTNLDYRASSASAVRGPTGCDDRLEFDVDGVLTAHVKTENTDNFRWL